MISLYIILYLNTLIGTHDFQKFKKRNILCNGAYYTSVKQEQHEARLAEWQILTFIQILTMIQQIRGRAEADVVKII